MLISKVHPKFFYKRLKYKWKIKHEVNFLRREFYFTAVYVTANLKRKLKLGSIKQRDIANFSIQTFSKIDSRDTSEQVELCVTSNDEKEIPVRCFVKDICAPVT